MTTRNRVLLAGVALVLTLLGTTVFAVRAIGHAHRLRARSNEPIQPWMNIPFIAHSYHVPPELLQRALGLPADRRDRRPLRMIAQEQGRSSDALIKDVMAAITKVQQAQPPPGNAPNERRP